jgi:hypothetical protein
MWEELSGNANAEAANIAGRLALMRAEVREYAARPEYANIREELLETVTRFERMINLLAKEAALASCGFDETPNAIDPRAPWRR